MSQHYKKQLHSVINDAKNLNELLSILRCTSLDKIKLFLDQNVDQLKDIGIKNMLFNAASINQIFPSDIIQHILSFQPFESHSNCVNKEWNKLSKQNERNYYSKLQKRLNETSPITYNERENSTWIMHQNRTKLREIEKEFNFQGPINVISDIMHRDAGDRFLIHPGIYENTDEPYYAYDIRNSLVMIGIHGRPTILDSGMEECGSFICIDKTSIVNMTKMYIENVTIDCQHDVDTTEGGIHIAQNNKLWLNNCKLLFQETGIMVRKFANLNVDNCEFDGATVAIEISPLANNVEVRNSIFRNCGLGNDHRNIGEDACIQIEDSCHDLKTEEDRGYCFVKLVCDGNVFEDNYGYPIAERARNLHSHKDTDQMYVPRRELYRLQNNILKGYNAKKVKRRKNIDDANKLYFNDEKFRPFPF